MARLRITLLLLALALAVPAALIVFRATESLERENAERHETVAERIFDEMERSLSDFLLRETARPVADYDRALLGEGGDDPLAPIFADAEEPFIVGWFVAPPDGETRTRAARGFASERVETALRAALGPPSGLSAGARDTEETRVHLTARDDRAPAPGRTRAIGRAGAGAGAEARERALAEPAAEADADAASGAYAVLQNLNRAGSLRSERQSKALEKRRARPPSKLLADSVAKEEGEAAEAPATGKKARTAVVDPWIGRTTAAGTVVLSRSVWRGERVERQGLVLDRDALIDWLGRPILAETGLAGRARLDFEPTGASADPAAYRYLHRFAEPFAGLVARLELEPLPDLGTARVLHALALFLFVALAIGLFAVDRMARVIVEYAQRRSDFVAAVSHELKTPLTAIRMYGEMLRDGLVSSEHKRAEYYATITDESERLSRLIDNVLEFSRLEQGRHAPEPVVGDPGETVRLAVEKLRPHAERAGFTLALDLPESHPSVRHDPDALTRIVFNLVDNALKYARDATRKTIEVELAPAHGGVALRVRDFGPGVPESQLARIFEPFYRIGEELTRTTEGTGIGLALVKELATTMGGAVRADRPPGGGLEIRVELPPA